jgi:hypothetical protein
MHRLLATPNDLSIGVPYLCPRMLLGMATTPLSKRCLRVRVAAGFGDERKAAEFARLIGIKPSSLHDIESGETKELGGKSLAGYIKIGANPQYLLYDKGLPMLKNIEKTLRAQTLVSQMLELEEIDMETVERMVKAFIRAKPGGSPNDPFKEDPPRDN